MANPTSIDDEMQVLEASTAAARSVTLNHLREYTIAHDGFDTTPASCTTTIFISTTTTATDDWGENTNQVRLLNGRSIVVGPGVNSVSFIADADGGAKAPTMSVIPGPQLGRGRIIQGA